MCMCSAPSYASELSFISQELPSRRAEEVAASPWRLQELLRQQAARVQASADTPVEEQVLESKAVVEDAEKLDKQAPPGYHLAWVSDGQNELAKENGGRDELPYFPMPPLDAEERAGKHVEWIAPGPCTLRDGTDLQSDDAECQHHEVVDDQYPELPLATSTFPSDSYRPDIQYPYIKGPFYHHLVDANDNQYQVCCKKMVERWRVGNTR